MPLTLRLGGRGQLVYIGNAGIKWALSHTRNKQAYNSRVGFPSTPSGMAIGSCVRTGTFSMDVLDGLLLLFLFFSVLENSKSVSGIFLLFPTALRSFYLG